MQNLIAIRAKYIYPVNSSPVTEGGIVVQNGKIIAVDSWEKLEHEYAFTRIIDMSNEMVLPAAINTHTHLELTELTTAVPENTPFVDWILGLVSVRRTMSDEVLMAATVHGIQMMHEAATAAVGEISSLAAGIDKLAQSGLHGIIYYELLGVDSKRADEILTQAQTKLLAWQKQYANSTMRFGLSLHTPYSTSPQLMKNTAVWCKEFNIPLSIHVGESADEHRLLMQGGGAIPEKLYALAGVGPEPFPIPHCTSVVYLDKLGVLEARPLLVHCVEVTEEDIQLLRDKNIPVAHCPRSNIRLLNGRFPMTAYLKAGVEVTMGTDSMASCSSLSIWDEIRVAWSLHNEAGETVSAHTYLACATLNGARALEVDDLYGSIERGKTALFATISMEDFTFAQKANADNALQAFITGQGSVTPWSEQLLNSWLATRAKR